MKKVTNRIKRVFVNYWQNSRWHKLIVAGALSMLVILGVMFGIAQWYIIGNRHQPRVLGASFIPAYAESLGLDPKETMDALINDVGVRHFRLVSYWNQLEPSPGTYDFSVLDWQFQKAEAAGAKVTLGLGLRQPRWPECHIPSWAVDRPAADWQPRLEAFIEQVIKRYKNSPALESYQLENEFFLKGFGLCTNHDRERLVSEYNLVKRLDPNRKLIITRSNNALGTPVGKPTPDEFGISIYKRVWDAAFTKRYLEYPFPSWYYAFVAGVQKMHTGKNMIVHELQAEAWPPNAQPIPAISLEEQNKSFNAERFEKRLEFIQGTGMREVYLWGAEYWYYRVVYHNDKTVWDVAKKAFHDPSWNQK